MIKGKIGVGVEGPSDLQFWDKVLPKHLQGWQFDIRNMKNRDKLVRAVPDLYEEFRNLKRQAAFVLLGSDKSPCVCEMLGFFDARILAEAKKPLTTRYLHLCVAVKRLECWYLADPDGINRLFPGSNYQSPADTSILHGKHEIEKMLKAHSKQPVGYNEIEFAKSFAPLFAPNRAERHSVSFRYYWRRISAVCQSQ